MKHLIFGLLLVVIYTSCWDRFDIQNPGKDREVEGRKPVYIQYTSDLIGSGEPRSIFKLENVIVYREYILVVEVLQGVHVINNSDPTNPQAVAFWTVPGIRNFTIANNTLFVPIVDKLISIDINDIQNIKVLAIQEGFFEEFDGNEFPEDYVGSFECIDPSKGIVLSWEPAVLFDPQCWR